MVDGGERLSKKWDQGKHDMGAGWVEIAKRKSGLKRMQRIAQVLLRDGEPAIVGSEALPHLRQRKAEQRPRMQAPESWAFGWLSERQHGLPR
jgi:hypothetical protein